MSDPRALVRVVDELLWCLRREGFAVSTAQGILVVQAVRAVSLDSRDEVREAIAAVVVHRRTDRRRFDATFDAFFSARARQRDLWTRLAAEGFLEPEIDALRRLLADVAAAEPDGLTPFGALLEGGADLDRALSLAGMARRVDAHSGPQLGFLAHRLLGQMGAGRARQLLGALRARLVDALGERGNALADALARQVEGSEEQVRLHVRETHQAKLAELERARSERRLETTPFAALTDEEHEEVRRAVWRLAERLRGGARVRARRARRGRLDPHRTLRAAFATGASHFARCARVACATVPSSSSCAT